MLTQSFYLRNLLHNVIHTKKFYRNITSIGVHSKKMLTLMLKQELRLLMRPMQPPRLQPGQQCAGPFVSHKSLNCGGDLSRVDSNEHIEIMDSYVKRDSFLKEKKLCIQTFCFIYRNSLEWVKQFNFRRWTSEQLFLVRHQILFYINTGLTNLELKKEKLFLRHF